MYLKTKVVSSWKPFKYIFILDLIRRLHSYGRNFLERNIVDNHQHHLDSDLQRNSKHKKSKPYTCKRSNEKSNEDSVKTK